MSVAVSVSVAVLVFAIAAVRAGTSVLHRWSFDSGDARDSVGSGAAGSVHGRLAHVRLVGANGSNRVLSLPTADDYALTAPLRASALRVATAFTLLSCFRCDAVASEAAFEIGRAVDAERAVVTLSGGPRLAASFLELSVLQRSGSVANSNRTAPVFVARVRDEGGATSSAPFALADVGMQFSCWALVVRGAETTLLIDGVPVLAHRTAFAGLRDGVASLLVGRARWSQLPSLSPALPLEVDVVEVHDGELARSSLIERATAIRCSDAMRGALLHRRPDGGQSALFEDGVDCQSRRDVVGISEVCGSCLARCQNGVQDGDEDDVDCGGVSCAACRGRAARHCVRLDQLIASSGVRRLNVTLAGGAIGVRVSAHAGLRVIVSAVGLVQCAKCPPIAGAHLFRYQFATATSVKATEVACSAEQAHSHDGCFGRTLESDPKHAWFVVDLQEAVALRELHWWLDARSPGCVRTAEIEVAGGDFRFRSAALVDFDTGASMQAIRLDASVAGAAVRFVRVNVKATVGDDATRRFSFAFRRILFYRQAGAADELRLAGSGSGVGVADDRLPTATHGESMDRGEIATVAFSGAPAVLQSVTLSVRSAEQRRDWRRAGAVLARLQCSEAATRRDVFADLRAGETALSEHMPRGVSSCALAATGDGDVAFQIAAICVKREQR
jgi:hypothetical protein